VALLHNAYLFWDRGTRMVRLNRSDTESMLGTPPSDGRPPAPETIYIQFPERMIWAQINEGQPHEPLDGVFVTRPTADDYRVLGVFGLHPDRLGFSVAEVAGTRLTSGVRPNGSPIFAPVLPGGAAAQLFSVDGAGELVELGARALSMAEKESAQPEAEKEKD